MTVSEAEKLRDRFEKEATEIEEDCKLNYNNRIEKHPLCGYYNFIHKYKSLLGSYIYTQSALPSGQTGQVTITGTGATMFSGSQQVHWQPIQHTSRRHSSQNPKTTYIPRDFSEQMKKHRAGVKFFKVMKMYLHFKNKWSSGLWSDEEKEIVDQITALLEKLHDKENWNKNTLKLINKYDSSK